MPDEWTDKIDHVMRLVEMGQLRIGPGNQINREAVMRLLGFDRPEALLGLPSVSEDYCPRCDTDDHRCPGCGTPVEHGAVACLECNRNA